MPEYMTNVLEFFTHSYDILVPYISSCLYSANFMGMQVLITVLTVYITASKTKTKTHCLLVYALSA